MNPLSSIIRHESTQQRMWPPDHGREDSTSQEDTGEPSLGLRS